MKRLTEKVLELYAKIDALALAEKYPSLVTSYHKEVKRFNRLNEVNEDHHSSMYADMSHGDYFKWWKQDRWVKITGSDRGRMEKVRAFESDIGSHSEESLIIPSLGHKLRDEPEQILNFIAELKQTVATRARKVKIGDVDDFSNMMNWPKFSFYLAARNRFPKQRKNWNT